MPSVRDFLGTKCPRCKADILQMAPSTNRMPSEDAWCPSCHAVMGVDELSRGGPRRPGLLKRLFAKPNRG